LAQIAQAMRAKLILLLIFISLYIQNARGQVVLQPLGSGVYDFLDEMAANKLIDLNSVVKPYPRRFVAEKLQELQGKTESLSRRQQKELTFYLRDFYKELPQTDSLEKRILRPLRKGPAMQRRFDALYYADSLFRITINPIGGIRLVANDEKNTYHRWAGAEAWAYAGKHIGLWASYRDNRQRLRLTNQGWLVQDQGAVFKNGVGQQGTFADFSEAKGGFTYAWKWGWVGFTKDDAMWGNNYNGANILSNHAPTYTQLRLQMKPTSWLELNYMHGWLVSEVIDSNNRYTNLRGQTRQAYRQKYIATNMVTFTPWRKLNFSIGNSIIYADQPVNPAYLIPIMFYKSVDHSQNGLDSNTNNVGQNSQLFFDISSRNLKHLHAFLSVFVDEISLTRILDKQRNSNFVSIKLGGRIVDPAGIKNLSLIGEFTHTNPYTYQHHNQTTTYESNLYNLGHYLRGNADELFGAIKVKPFRAAYLQLSFSQARKGKEPVYGVDRLKGYPFLQTLVWKNTQISGEGRIEILNDAFVWGKITYSSIYDPGKLYSPTWMIGKHTTLEAGMAFGF